MKWLIILIILFQGCSLKKEVKNKVQKKSLKDELQVFGSYVCQLRNKCKQDNSYYISFEKIDAFIEYSKKDIILQDKVKELNNELDINKEVLNVLQAYNMKNTANQELKSECLSLTRKLNNQYNTIRKKLDYKEK